MPYLPPSVVLDRLSAFTGGTLVDTVSEDSKFVRAQVGSMASTLDFLAKETAHREGSILKQRAALLDALQALESLGDETATAFVNERRQAVEAVETTMGNTEAVREELVESMCALQRAVADGTFGTDTPEARGVLHDLFETRVESQLEVLGRDS